MNTEQQIYAVLIVVGLVGIGLIWRFTYNTFRRPFRW